MTVHDRLVDLNEATREQLEAVLGLGPAGVEAVLARREEVGRFASIDALQGLPGIDDATLERLRGVAHATADAAMVLPNAVAAITGPAADAAVTSLARAASQLPAIREVGAAMPAGRGQLAEHVGQLWLSWWPEQASDGVRTAVALSQCRDWREVAEVQSRFLRSSVDRLGRLWSGMLGAQLGLRAGG